RATPATRCARSGSSVRGFSHTDIDMSRIEAGQATALKSLPSFDAKIVDDEKRFAVSPMTLREIPAASKNHANVERPASSTVPPMTNESNKRSPMGDPRVAPRAAPPPPRSVKDSRDREGREKGGPPEPRHNAVEPVRPRKP